MDENKDMKETPQPNLEGEKETIVDTESEPAAEPTDSEDDARGVEAETEAEVDQEPSKKEDGRKFFRRKGDKKKEEELLKKIESLTSRLADLDSKLSDANDKYLRLAAEFDNFRRRTARERLELISSAGEDVLKGILPTLDDCEKALEMLSKLEGCEAAVEGTKLIYDKLTAYLKSRGVIRIDAAGADFDTDLHEAVAQFPVQEEERKNKVIDVVRQGYKLKDKVIRYAQVVVGI